jgi:hypothetical protein
MASTRNRAAAAAVERRNRANELLLLGETLRNADACDDITPLHSAAHQCGTGAASIGDWYYDLSRLRFRLPSLPGSKPDGISGFVATLSASLAGRAVDEEDGDPLAYSAVDLVLTADASYGTEKGTASAAWHFDRHVGATDERPSELHPLYHVQYGGRGMREVDLGRTMLSDPPRLLHPPMDAVLAVDLVVANFMYKAWTILREDPTYVRLVDSSYHRLWRPWFSCISSFWSPNAHLRWNQHQRLCPALVEPALPLGANVTTPIGASKRQKKRSRRS